MAARGPQNSQRGLERGLPLDFCALPSTFAINKGAFDKKPAFAKFWGGPHFDPSKGGASKNEHTAIF